MKLLNIGLFFLLILGKDGFHKEYYQEYYANGTLKAQGWKNGTDKEGFWEFYFSNGSLMKKGHFQNDLQEGYWYFYTESGHLKKEGHYSKGKKVMWWVFYNENGEIDHKCQLQKGVKNGYNLKYENEKLISAEKYLNGKKIKEWYDLNSFKRENNLFDLM